MHPSHRTVPGEESGESSSPQIPHPAPSEEGGSQGELDLTTSETAAPTEAEHRAP